MDIIFGCFFAIIVSLLLTGFYAWIVWWLDRYEKEPWWLLILVFTWGLIFAPILSIIIELILDIPISILGEELNVEVTQLTSDLISTSIIAPIVEESTKALPILFIFLFIWHELDSILDGIIYGAMAGLGFALTENLLYFLGALMEDGLLAMGFLVFIRAILFGLNHAFFTSLTGAGLAIAKFSYNGLVRFIAPIGGLAAAIIFHALHNLGATLATENCLSIFISFGADYGGLFLLVIIIFLISRKEKSWIESQLKPEIGILISQEEYVIIHSSTKRFSMQSKLFFGNAKTRQQGRIWRKLTQTATELAFIKYQLSRFGDKKGNQNRYEQYQQKLKELQESLQQLKKQAISTKPTTPQKINVDTQPNNSQMSDLDAELFSDKEE